MTKPIFTTLIFALLPLANVWADAPAFKIGGSTTTYPVFKAVVPNVEKIVGRKIELSQKSTGGGIVELLEGKTDLTMTSEPLDVAIEAAKNAGAKVTDADKFRIFAVTTQEVAFVVNPKNPVSALTRKEMGSIQTGEIKNWKEVGGADLPIHVYAEKAGRGTRAMIVKKVMDGHDFGPNTQAQETIEKAAELVANDPAGFASVGSAFADKFKLKRLQSEIMRRPIGFITHGDPTPEQDAVIKAFQKQFDK